MAVMVNGGGAGGGGGWINITDSVTLGSGKKIIAYSSGPQIENNANGSHVLIENIQPGERYRVTGWICNGSPVQELQAALVDDSNNILSYSTRHTQSSEHANDAYGDGKTAGTSSATKLYAPIEVAIPKLPGVSKLMVIHGAIPAGSTYDDVIVEKYIG